MHTYPASKGLDSPSHDCQPRMYDGATIINLSPVKNNQSGQSIISWLKELFIDIVSSFFPGVVFASYLVFMSVLWLCLVCTQARNAVGAFVHPSFVNDGTGTLFVNSPGEGLTSFSGNSLLTWCFVAFAFMVGFVLQRKDPELPDYVSQMHKAIRSHWMMPWAFSVLYMVVFALVPTSVIIRVYNYVIYRMDGCCGFGSRKASQRTDENKRDEKEEKARKLLRDGLINNKSCRKSNALFIVPRVITAGNLLKCLFSVCAESRDYIWRLCSTEKNGKGARFERCKTHRSKLTKYPYEDYYTSYLKSRNLTYLEPYVLWDKWEKDKSGSKEFIFSEQALIRSRRVIDLLKNRIRSIIPEETEDLVRWETHIRLASAIWYLTKFIIHTTVFSALFLLAVHYHKYLPGCNFLETIQLKISCPPLNDFFVVAHICIIFVASFLNYSISGFLHYIRLKEIAGILDWLHYIHTNDQLKSKLHWEDFLNKKEKPTRQNKDQKTT